MTTYSTSFDSYTADAQPSDWTARWVTASNNWLVRSKASTVGGKVLENTATVDGRHFLTWDALDADANRADVEILARVRSSSSTSDQFRLTVRGSGAAGAETGYNLLFVSATVSLRLHKYVAGVSTNIGSSAGMSLSTNTWYYVRFRVNGTTLQAKVWLDTVEEPAAWTLTETDSSISAAGWVGVGNFTATGTRDIDLFSVGTNGDTAVKTSATTEVRTSQAVSEVAHAIVAEGRVSQVVSEVAHAIVAEGRVSQVVAEVAFSEPIPARISQMVVEIAFESVPDPIPSGQQPRMIVIC